MMTKAKEVSAEPTAPVGASGKHHNTSGKRNEKEKENLLQNDGSLLPLFVTSCINVMFLVKNRLSVALCTAPLSHAVPSGQTQILHFLVFSI